MPDAFSLRLLATDMTLRDWFAGQALAGLLVNHSPLEASCEDVAEAAYQFADAMLSERLV